MPMQVKERLRSWAGAEVSSRSLGLIRIFAIAVMLYRFCGPWVAHKVDVHGPALYFVWLFMAGAMVALFGYKTRWATGVMAVAFATLYFYFGKHLGIGVFGKPVQPVQVTLLLAITPCGRSLSVDRVLENRRARREGRPPSPETVEWWLLELFVLQICVIYFWAAFDKSDAQWFAGERLERLWVDWYGTSDSLATQPLLTPLAKLSAWWVIGVEYGLVPLLLWRKTRHYALWAGLFLHLSIFFALSVPHFTSMMFVMYIACARPWRVHAFLADMLTPEPPPPPSTGEEE